MNNRLPPAWSKHLKVQTGPKPKFPQQNLRQENPLSRTQADDALLEQAYQFQQAKRLNEAQELCLRLAGAHA
ncbi:hypothetical protein [Mesorhizobium sangaii]|uniref:Uncharacterized protein n=1 Tax=Mesorhizobium sangaii TaxID=505389 RepID=A0A841PCW5_9HYPH|nr:hypothetical protein [Mesorhizobium sangaii]MBB6408112.1 hypothetical protein [Mesorhizobium sangaii]